LVPGACLEDAIRAVVESEFNGKTMNVGENLDENETWIVKNRKSIEKAPILLVLRTIGFVSFNGGSLERKS
jgi:hypothetical protein